MVYDEFELSMTTSLSIYIYIYIFHTVASPWFITMRTVVLQSS